MNPPETDFRSSDDPLSDADRDTIYSGLFRNLIAQQGNMALMFLGKIPNPDGGGFSVDLEAAKLFVDQLEMIEVKTRGNLTAAEAEELQRSLSQVKKDFITVLERETGG